ncbi:MAG: methionyl-tRNA formyltransferase [Bacteroidales bacterium]|jgi:methionyl-tRNA formyltransferase|nr:methionyl-tRNA formyltransferase [Bacteroidales bacterium]MDI9575379.1 methionyl-tRNA formyltransferase [Bacteroidota bacterium]MDD2593473.1 methionyl-tRNA formyltransferase [Bacteroidales bacterium]MDD3755706.1 methionyl-tRNA formyltransferase [Bacteroidales bacterium]MDY0400705.1 methionyl-tRNA formyltransferase [Bacteroidales bacterium]
MQKANIVFMGTPDFAVPSLELLATHHNILLVVTTPDKPAGRGLKIQYSPIKTKALELQLPVSQPVLLKDPDFINQIKNINPDFIIVVAFRIIPDEIFKIPKLGTINLHPSLLPKYRGPSPIQWAIINGENQTGVTTIFLNEKIDSGPILLQETEPIYDNDNFLTLHNRLKIKGAKLLLETINGVIDNTITPKMQDNLVKQNNLYAPKITKEMTKLDLSRSCVYNWRVIRALYPKPAAYIYLVDDNKKKILKILEADYDLRISNPGDFTLLDKHNFAIGCSDGILIPKTVALEGRKVMTSSEFLRGMHFSKIMHFE